ncbi:MAG: spore coat associated protein CotJA [Clostridia bacterium]|nr:spore coat associated protein CotJA [Clostridia bacterium]
MLSRHNATCTSCGENRTESNSKNMNSHCDDCHCGDYSNNDFNYSLAMVYSPEQEWQNLYCEEEGFMAGTIFKELDKPFYGAKCMGGSCHE